MGRPRLSGQDLPPRVYFYHGAFYYAPKGGKRTWLARTFKEAMVEWAKLVDRPQAYRTMNALFDRYLLDVTPGKADATQRDDHRAMPYLRAFFGEMDPADVDAGSGYAFLEERGKQATVRANREFAVLRHVMTMAVRWKVVKANPLYRIVKNPETPRVREVKPEEVLAWYRFAGPKLAAYTALKLLIGLRKGDMLRLRKEWWSDDGLYAEVGKNRKRLLFTHTRALDRAVQRILGRRVSRRGVAVRVRAGGADGPLFATRSGKHYTESGFDSIWQRRMRVLAAAGYERFTEHDLRSKAGDDAEAAGREGHRLLANTEAQFRRAYQRRTQRVQPVR